MTPDWLDTHEDNQHEECGFAAGIVNLVIFYIALGIAIFAAWVLWHWRVQ